MPWDGKAAAAVGAGSLLLYSGVRGFSILKAIQNIVQGAPASTGQTTNLIGNPASQTGAAALGTAASVTTLGTTGVPFGSAGSLVGAARSVVGHPYLYGGAPGSNGQGPWDCSSCVNWVANRLAHLPIPGYGPGQYPGTSHGPATGVWLVWPGLTTVGHDASVAQAGDIIVWQTHMGICTGPGRMVSAETPSGGTREDPLTNGFMPGELMFVRRYH